ncbi:hypothetical protein MTR_6g027050 [Medicago truncatula]|uniref:Uncharacterized protein n=1 Tax=Medicago truncatula TaxID=3880 RepID=G7KPJ3_MEDTR|nr:hypothetical protein MTR_6g027050 [Medicago truncatula]
MKNFKCSDRKLDMGLRLRERQPGALKLPHTQGPRRGPTIIDVLYAALLCFYTRGCFQDLNL